jgi:hypothetical protein
MNADRKEGGGEGGAEAPPRVRKFGCLKIFLCGLGLVLLVLGYWYVRLYFARSEFLRHAEELVAEIETGRPRVPDEENAAPLYLDAFALYVDPQASGVSADDAPNLRAGSSWVGYGGGLSDVMKASPESTARFLRANKPCLEAIRKAMKRPQCDFGLSLRDSELALPPKCWTIHSTLSLLAIDTLNAGREGRMNNAVESHGRCLRLAGDVGSAGTPGMRMLQLHCETSAAESLAQILNTFAPEELQVHAFLATMDHHLAARGELGPCLRAGKAAFLCSFYGPLVSGEKEVLWPAFKSPGEYALAGQWGEEPNTTGRFLLGAWQRSGFVLRDARAYERAMQQRVAVAARSLPQLLDEVELRREDDQSGWWALTSPVAIRHVDGLITLDALALAKLRAAQLALGCRLHKLKFGAYPENLADLSTKFPEFFKTLPLDPFTGKDFLYKRTAAGCRVWSVGKNRQDDGGLSRAERDMKKPDVYDEVFELKR